MTAHELKQALRRDRVLLGTLIISPSPFWPKLVAGAGLDFVFIDTEHIALNRESVSWMCRAYAALGLPPLVRIPTRDPDDATVALDDGAAGVIVPYVETAETARAMVGATKFRPLKGKRLADTLDGLPLDAELEAYITERNAGHLIALNIESVPAMAALDDILAVEGLDTVLIGPHDLSTSLGVPEQYGHPKFLAACEFILGRARAAGIGAGIHHWLPPAEQVRFAAMGANLMIYKADATFFQESMQRDLAEIRGLLDDGASSSAPSVESI